MSTITLDKLLADAMTLSLEDRALLAARLRESCIDPEILEQHLNEVERRIEAFESGVMEDIDGDELLRDLEAGRRP